MGKVVTCFDLGTQTISLASFSSKGQGDLQLESYFTRELLADPAAEASRLPQMRLAIRELAVQAGLKSCKINYALPGQSIFSRFVKLPAMDPEKLHQIAGFEAQQNIPFPLEEVVWDYELLNRPDQPEVEVVLVAVRKDLLNEVNHAMEAPGLLVQTVDVAPTALYNALRYNYSEVEGCILLIDIGARTTNLIFSEPGLVFSRSIPSGGNNLTMAIAKEFGESFAMAEKRKCRDGLVHLGGVYEDPSNQEVADMSKILRNNMARLHAEISRSIGFYRAQKKGNKPSCILLAGGSCATPYTREFFSEKLQIPVELFNPLRNVTISSSLSSGDILPQAYLLGELVGLGLRGTIAKCPISLNLRPTSVIARQEMEAKKPFLLTAAACFILAVLGWGIYYLQAAKTLNRAAEKLQPKIAHLSNLEQKIEKLQREIDELRAISEPMMAVAEERQYWSALINDLNRCLPERFIWLTILEPTVDQIVLEPSNQKGIEAILAEVAVKTSSKPSKASKKASKSGKTLQVAQINGLRVKGLYLKNPSRAAVVDDFIENLMKSEFIDIRPETRSEIVKTRATENEAEWAYEFELYLPLKKTIALR